jgi:transcription initiation factor TFIID subunit TAF12
MGLFGMMARTAVVAGTATAVSGRVARRQQAKYEQKADAQAYQEQQQAPQQQYEQAPQQYEQPAPQYQQPPPAPPAPAAAAAPNLVDEIQRLSTLKDQGILSADEFTAAKNKLLGI